MENPRVVRAGVLSPARAAAYLALGLLAGAATVAALAPWASTVLRVLAGLTTLVLVAGVLLAWDAVIVSAATIRQRKPFHRTTIGWDEVTGADFTVAQGRWLFTLSTPRGPLALLSMPPVTGPVQDPAALRNRERLIALRELLRQQSVAVSIDADIAAALHTHWRIAAPPPAQ